MNYFIKCPVCGQELDLRCPCQFPEHMVQDKEHRKHIERTEMKMALKQLMPYEGMPN